MISLSDHLAAVLALAGPAVRQEPVALALADGRVLAEDLQSRWPLPPFTSSGMDGYAVRAADLPASALRVLADGRAGTAAASLPEVTAGTCTRIATGAPLPAGADTVVPWERTTVSGTSVAVPAAVDPGAHVRPAGQELAAGDLLLTAGTRLGPAQLALLAAGGYAEVPVAARPRVVVVSSGHELADPGQPLAAAQTPDSNTPALVAACTRAGAQVLASERLPDEPDGYRQRLEELADGADLLLSSGGVSVGPHDPVRLAFADSLAFVQVAIQPGMPQALGRVAGVPYVGLPGNPVSALVCFELFVAPLLAALTGAQHRVVRVPVTVTGPLTSPAGKRQFRRVRLHANHSDDAGPRVDPGLRADPGPGDDAELRADAGPRADARPRAEPGLRAEPVGGAGSQLVAGLAHADALLEIDTDVTSVAPGTTLWARLLP